METLQKHQDRLLMHDKAISDGTKLPLLETEYRQQRPSLLLGAHWNVSDKEELIWIICAAYNMFVYENIS